MPITHGGVIIAPDSTGKTIDLAQVASGRWREVDCLGSPTVDDAIIEPSNVDLVAAASYALPVREARAGGTGYHLLVAASNNATSLKASAGRLIKAHVYNAASYPVFLKFYNKASSPAPATDNALLVQVVGCQAGITANFPVSRDGIAFSTGIAFAVVKGISNTDNTSVAANDCLIELEYL